MTPSFFRSEGIGPSSFSWSETGELCNLIEEFAHACTTEDSVEKPTVCPKSERRVWGRVV